MHSIKAEYKNNLDNSIQKLTYKSYKYLAQIILVRIK